MYRVGAVSERNDISETRARGLPVLLEIVFEEEQPDNALLGVLNRISGAIKRE
jgi:hypothetical protein